MGELIDLVEWLIDCLVKNNANWLIDQLIDEVIV